MQSPIINLDKVKRVKCQELKPKTNNIHSFNIPFFGVLNAKLIRRFR